MLGEIVRHGRARRGRIGIGVGTVPLPRRLVLHHGLDQVHGAGVLQVLPGGPADEAGLLTGNIVIAAGGTAVNGAGD